MLKTSAELPMQRVPAYNITAVATLDVQRQPPEEAPSLRHAEPCLAGSFRGPDAADLAHLGCRMSLPGHSEASPARHQASMQGYPPALLRLVGCSCLQRHVQWYMTAQDIPIRPVQ